LLESPDLALLIAQCEGFVCAKGYDILPDHSREDRESLRGLLLDQI
jgi:hypothetical protein